MATERNDSGEMSVPKEMTLQDRTPRIGTVIVLAIFPMKTSQTLYAQYQQQNTQQSKGVHGHPQATTRHHVRGVP